MAKKTKGIIYSAGFTAFLGMLWFASAQFFPGLRHVALVAFVASLSTLILTPFVIVLAKKYGAVDAPNEARKIHTAVTPRWGGIAIFLGVLIAVCLNFSSLHDIRAVLIATAFIFVVGVIDDLRGLSSATRGITQLAACIILITAGIRITFLPDTWWGNSLEIMLTILWLVGITNALNFLDGMNGLVSGLGAGCALVFTILALILNQPALAYLSGALCASCICFIGFNCIPSRIFLGDCGSTTIGFLLASLGIIGEWSGNGRDPFVSFVVPVIVLSVAIYDMIFTTIARIHSGKVHTFREWLDYTGRDHLHHRINHLGWSRMQTVFIIWFINLAISFSAVYMLNAPFAYGIIAVLQTICIYLLVALLEVSATRINNELKELKTNNHLNSQPQSDSQ
jgi:UDP-GlcNAc:undecaprenyl-phosphate GlcNAc-1-phosphate transferase